MPDPTGMMTSTVTGAELLLGNGLVVQLDSSARTDTAAADGEVHVYISGATIILQVFSKDAGVWRSATLS